MYIIKLACPGCGRAWGHVIDGSLVIESKHGGDKHTNAINAVTLLALLRGSSRIGDENLLRDLFAQINLSPSLVEILTDPVSDLDKRKQSL